MEKQKNIQVPNDLWQQSNPVFDKSPLKFRIGVDKKYGLMWMLSLNNAIRNGGIAADILEGKLSQADFNKIKGGYFTNEYMFSGALPVFYLKYGSLLDLKKKKSELEETFFSTTINNPRKDSVIIGSSFRYNKESDGLMNLETKEIVWKGNELPQEIKLELQHNPDIVFKLSDKTNSGANFYITAPIRSIKTKKQIEELQKQIDVLSFDLQNISDDEINIQQSDFIEKYVMPAVPYLEKNIRAEIRREEAGISVEEMKQLQKEKRETQKEQRIEEQEYQREDFLTKNKVPRTISEFEKSDSVIRCSDVAVGDLVFFKEAVYSGDHKRPKYEGDRRILGLIEGESYGRNKGQHSFSIYVLDSDGKEPFSSGVTIRRMGRTMYKACSAIQYATDEVRQEKHEKGQQAKERKYWSWLMEAENEDKPFKVDKIPSWFIQKNIEQIKSSYPRIASMVNIDKMGKGGVVDENSTNAEPTIYNEELLTINTSYDIPESLKIQLQSTAVPKKKYDLPFDTSNWAALDDISKKIRGNDDLRPYFKYAYCLDNTVAFTDAHKMIFIPKIGKFNGILNPERKIEVKASEVPFGFNPKNKEENGFYKVIPKYTEKDYQGEVTVSKLHDYFNFFKINFFERDYFSPTLASLLYKREDKREKLSVNVELILDLLTVFMKLGIKKIHVYASTPYKGILFCENRWGNTPKNETWEQAKYAYDKISKGKFVYALLMPVMNGNITNDTESNSSYMNLDKDEVVNMIYDLGADDIKNKNGETDYFYNTPSLLSASEFNLTRKSFDTAVREQKKRQINYALRDKMEAVFDFFKSKFEDKVGNVDDIKQQKLDLSLHWLNTFYLRAKL